MFTSPGMLTPYAYDWCATRYIESHWTMPDLHGYLEPRPLWKGKKAVYVRSTMDKWGLAKHWASVMKTRVNSHIWDMEDRTQAVSMSLHARLGAASPIRVLDGETFRDVATPPIVFNG